MTAKFAFFPADSDVPQRGMAFSESNDSDLALKDVLNAISILTDAEPREIHILILSDNSQFNR